MDQPCKWGILLPFAAMVTVQFTDVGISTISKAAMSRGMSSYVLIVYSNALATLLLLPSFILQKKQVSLTFSFLSGLFLLGLIGSSSILLAYNGINYSSPTLSSAMANLIPIYTFMLAIIFRLEKLDLRRSSSQAKVLGTIVSVSGAFIIILYKGLVILKPSSPSNFLMISHQSNSRWVFGGLMLAMSCLLSAIWNIVQASTVKNCPSKVTVVFFYTFFMTIQCTIFSLIVERNPNTWVIRPGIEMISIVCSAIMGNVFHVGVHTWCLHQKGPVFVAMFRPLGVAIAAVMVVFFLGDPLHLGSVVGSVIIAIGFYAMMWAQIKEKGSNVVENEVHSLASTNQHTTPLLQCRSTEEENV
ncbi:WAT1-related protein At3g28050 isoform X1 [Rosa chinensis]|uniref:WAT1-related protein At3g28050 isoform X1 n=1 Tax=Rosa chinensis TaxID=74649 RepID=UPI000D088810|nr:WAT1-related protein At3g28050 isoform X1 [Rosa chinensis]